MRVSTSTINSLATNSMNNSYKTYIDIMNKIASNKNFTKDFFTSEIVCECSILRNC